MNGPKSYNLLLNGERIESGLFEELDYAAAAVELGLGFGVEVGAELGKGREFAELGEFALEFTTDLLGGFDLRGRTDARDGLIRRAGCLG